MFGLLAEVKSLYGHSTSFITLPSSPKILTLGSVANFSLNVTYTLTVSPVPATVTSPSLKCETFKIPKSLHSGAVLS